MSAYLCDPSTAHAEFLLVKSQYQAETGREVERGALCYQIRQAFPKGELTPDYGAPELAAQRGLKSDNPQFTRWVLQSHELRQALKQWEKASVRVEPLFPDSTQHMVCVLTAMDDFDMDDFLLEDWRRKKAYEESGLFERLDTLADLLEAARDAVTAWPMPQNMEAPK